MFENFIVFEVIKKIVESIRKGRIVGKLYPSLDIEFKDILNRPYFNSVNNREGRKEIMELKIMELKEKLCFLENIKKQMEVSNKN